MKKSRRDFLKAIAVLGATSSQLLRLEERLGSECRTQLIQRWSGGYPE